MLLKPSSPEKGDALGQSPAFGQVHSPPSPIKVLRDAWELVRVSRALWWVGVLAGLGQGYGMNAQLAYRLDSEDVVFLQQTIQRLTPTDSLLLLISILFLLVLWVFSVVAEAGLMKSVLARKDGHQVSFRSTLAEGRPNLWPLVKLNVVIAFFSFFFILTIGLPAALATSTSTTGLITGSIGIVLILIYGIMIALLYPWMTRFVVLRNHAVGEAIRSAWRLFRLRPGLLFKLGIGGLLVQVFGAVLLALILIILLVPLFIVEALIFRSSPELTSWPVLSGLLVVGLLSVGILTAFKNAYYTLAFDRVGHA